eukprot:TRINITY_DN8633_c0_g1_i2.p2 TRINITY_DN8633_c0_g1~~TRINITY_DN8633_c0_g1_i2.p2  ORF type:complete len:376 (+),score=98.62 TRINITY_DN8633_c0_g1_i2:87-1214(+)
MAEHLSEAVVEQLRSWKLDCVQKNQELKIYAGLDVGGTNARLAFARSDRPVDDILVVRKFKASDGATLLEALRSLADELASFDVVRGHVVAGCVAGAGPADGRQITVTNYHEPRTIRVTDLPPLMFPPGKSLMINDLEGTCEGISAFGSLGKLSTYFQPLWTSEPDQYITLKCVNYAVLAMGTGLGTAALVRSATRTHHKVLALEYGHTHVTPLGVGHPDYAQERQLFEFLSTSIWKGQYPPENEDICSGRGLLHCYRFVTRHVPDAPQAADPAAVAQLAQAGDKNALDAMQIHYRYLMRVAQTMCVGLQTKGVFLAGDNQVANDAFVVAQTKQLQQELRNHQKHEWVDDVSVYRQVVSYNLNLLGCIFVASRLA